MHAGNSLCLADAAEETARLARVYAVDASRISYDGVGVGRDFRNHLVKRGLGDAISYAGSGRPRDPKAFTNLRSEAAWRMSRRLDPERHTDDRYPTSSRQPPSHIPRFLRGPSVIVDSFDDDRCLNAGDFCPLLNCVRFRSKRD